MGMKVVVVGASSGLGRCIGVGLARQGHRVALLARRVDRLEAARAEAGGSAEVVACDVTDPVSGREAIDTAADRLGGVDALVYTPAISPLVRLADTDADTWQRIFATNVTGAALVAAAALPHLEKSGGTAVFLSSVAGSHTPPWPGLGAYAVSKAALDKLVEAWRAEHPHVGFTRLTVGDCIGGDGDSITGIANSWEPGMAAEMVDLWMARNYMNGALIDVDHLVGVVAAVLANGASISMPSVVVTPRPAAPA
jgi:NAD(P)-dependent dehydrogenase (short-subunit alcohol dehydrogenase family)